MFYGARLSKTVHQSELNHSQASSFIVREGDHPAQWGDICAIESHVIAYLHAFGITAIYQTSHGDVILSK